jgi:hypothetical protein
VIISKTKPKDLGEKLAAVPLFPLSLSLSIYIQPFVRPWLLFQFLDLLHSRYDFLDRGSAGRKAATYTQNNTVTE